MGKKRAQAAVEFLTTYGWAIMGVIVIIGALSYFDFLDADRFISERCDTGSQLQCVEMFANDDGDVRLALKNNYPVDIMIEQVIVEGVPIGSVVPISSGNTTSFAGNIGLMSRGNKEHLDAVIVFRRNVPSSNKYNVSGSLVVKVQDADDFPITSQAVCGDSITTYPEICDLGDYDKACSDFGLSGTLPVKCSVALNCKWDTSVCEYIDENCGDGDLDPGELCDKAITTYTCAGIGQPYGGPASAPCLADCTGHNTSLCVGSDECHNSTFCGPEKICIDGLCQESCDSFYSTSSCDSTGCKCSIGDEDVLSSGICVLNSSSDEIIPFLTFCDNSIAVKTISSFNSDCNLNLVGSPCDKDTLAGGYIQSGICLPDKTCGPTPSGLADGEACLAGSWCANHTCVAGFCRSNCNSFNGQLCSRDESNYYEYGVCTLDGPGEVASSCDNDLAVNYTGIYVKDCSSAIVSGKDCDSDTLAGGIHIDGFCDHGICNTSESVNLPDDSPCGKGSVCASGLCVDGFCRSECTGYNGAFCSENSYPPNEYGICAFNNPPPGVTGICDTFLASNDSDRYYDNCTGVPDGAVCDSNGLVGGFAVDGTCQSGFCDTGAAGLEDGQSCMYGNICASRLCVYSYLTGTGICVASCEGDNLGMLCSKNSYSDYNNHGICVESSSESPSTPYECDTNVAVVDVGTGKIVSECNSSLITKPCDPGSLAGGFYLTGTCQANGECKSATPEVECTDNSPCSYGICISGVCAQNSVGCLYGLGQLCSSSGMSFREYGVCTKTGAAYTCDDDVAVKQTPYFIYGECDASLLDKPCDPDGLAGGLHLTYTCVQLGGVYVCH
ncbi:MAG: hypothetical protein ACP5N3_03945 [Candidatus Nanoarchaeia archaeon]